MIIGLGLDPMVGKKIAMRWSSCFRQPINGHAARLFRGFSPCKPGEDQRKGELQGFQAFVECHSTTSSASASLITSLNVCHRPIPALSDGQSGPLVLNSCTSHRLPASWQGLQFSHPAPPAVETFRQSCNMDLSCLCYHNTIQHSRTMEATRLCPRRHQSIVSQQPTRRHSNQTPPPHCSNLASATVEK